MNTLLRDMFVKNANYVQETIVQHIHQKMNAVSV